MKIDIQEKTFNFKNTPTERTATKKIIIHHTGNSDGSDTDPSAEQIHGWHLNNGWAGIGYHFVVRKNGIIERGRPEWAVGSHAYGANADSVGIHLSGTFTGNNRPTDAQIENAARLVAFLCEKYGITCDRQHVIGHREIAGDTDCPGKNLFDKLSLITGKANFYLNAGGNVVDGSATKKTRYNKVEELPDWAKIPIQSLMDAQILNGDENGNLDLSMDMIRTLIICKRMWEK